MHQRTSKSELSQACLLILDENIEFWSVSLILVYVNKKIKYRICESNKLSYMLIKNKISYMVIKIKYRICIKYHKSSAHHLFTHGGPHGSKRPGLWAGPQPCVTNAVTNSYDLYVFTVFLELI